MRRMIIQGLLACLLALFPGGLVAQTLTGYEFWFDDDFAGRKTFTTSGSYREIRLSADTYFMPVGVHKISFRVRQSDGYYSAVSSSLFLKRVSAEATTLEYWFDDNFDQRESRVISDTQEEQQLSLDLRSNTLYPPGFHQLKMRVTVAGQGVSTVCSAGVLKISAGKVSTLEYWVDDDYSNVRTIDAQTIEGGYVFTSDLNMKGVSQGFHRLCFRARSSSGRTATAVSSAMFYMLSKGKVTGLEYWIDDDLAGAKTIECGAVSGEYTFINDLDMRDVPMGYHVLNVRARSNSHGTTSAVSSTGFLKVGTGGTTRLEYWLDDDDKNIRQLTGEQIADGYIFIKNLNLGSVAPGQHRLYLRARNSSGQMRTAVTMVPVIVKLNYGPYYGVEDGTTNTATVNKYSITVDNGTPSYYNVPNPKHLVTQQHVLDARELTAGNHTLKAKFWNSANAGVSTEKTFKVVVPEEPKITLTAQQQGGLVKLQFNSVPGEYVYAIRSTDANGVFRRIINEKGDFYPETQTYTDNPPAGTYTYYVKMKYRDWFGNDKELRSNDVTVTVGNAQTEEEATEQYATITGKIVCDKNTPTSGLSVKFVEDGVTVPVQGTVFSRTQVPVGNSLTMNVLGDNTHTYKTAQLTVKPGNNDVTINGTLREEYQPDNMSSDLEISDLLLTSQQNGLHVKMYLKNRSQDVAWRGKVHIKAINKKLADGDNETVGFNPFVTENMYYGVSYTVSFEPGRGQYVELDIPGLTVKKSSDYYFYFESIGNFVNSNKGNLTKPVIANSQSSVNSNPFVKTVLPPPAPQVQYTKWDNEAKEAFAYLMLGAASVTPGSEGLIGDAEEFAQQVMTAIGATSREAAALAIGLWLEGKDGLQAINDANLKLVSDAAKFVFDKARKDVKKRIINKFWTVLAIGVGDGVKDARPFIEFIIEAVKVSKKSTLHQVMTCMSVMYSALASNPCNVGNDMKALMVVGESLAKEAKNILEIRNTHFIGNRLVANRKYTKTNDDNDDDNDQRVNTAVDIKLIVNDNKKGKAIDFTKDKYYEQIKTITLVLRKSEYAEANVFSFNLIPHEDCIMLETVQDGNIRNTGPVWNLGDLAHELYMEIHWKNERVTQIPLLKSDDYQGVDININGAHVSNYDGDYQNEPVIIYTIMLTTESGKDDMADKLYLGTNSERK